MEQFRLQMAQMFREDRYWELGNQGSLPAGRARLDLEDETGFKERRGKRKRSPGKGHNISRARVSQTTCSCPRGAIEE